MNETPLCLNCSSYETYWFLNATDIYGNQHVYRKCLQCGLVFIWPLPDDSIFDKIYGADYYGTDHEEKFTSGFIVKAIDYFAKCRAKRFASMLPDRARIMDVGCGNGRFLEHLHALKRGFELNGIEIAPKAALRATHRLKGRAWIHTVTDLEKFFGRNAFDAVSYIHVFEHLPDPSGEMNRLKHVVRPSGVVMIVIPNITSLQAKKYKSKWFHLDPPRHINFYPSQLLMAEMENRGFQTVSVRYFDPEQNPFGEVQSMLNLWFKKRDVLFERLKGNKHYAPEYGWLHVFFMKLIFVLMMPLCILGDVIAAKRKNSATVEMIFRKNSA